MIQLKDMMPVPYLKKAPFTGSYKGMRYLLRKRENENGETYLEAVLWPDVFCFEKTPEEEKQSGQFEFTGEGIEAAVDWLNSEYEKQSKYFGALKSGKSGR